MRPELERRARGLPLTQERPAITLRRPQAGKPQRSDAGQGSGPRAPPTREASPAMGSLPQRPDPRHTARQSKTARPTLGAQRRTRGVGARCLHAARQPTPAPRSARVMPATVVLQHRGPPDTPSCPRGQTAIAVLLVRTARSGLDAGALGHYIPNACTEGGKTAEDQWQEWHRR